MRCFEFVEGTSSKFWNIEVQGDEVTTWWGRIGTAGQSKSKSYSDATAAQNDADKQIREKTKKGYSEVGSAPAVAPPPPKAPAPKPPAPASPTTVAPVASTVVAKPPPAAPTASLPDEDAFVLPSSWKAKLHPRRGGRVVVEPDAPSDEKKLLGRIKGSPPPAADLAAWATLAQAQSSDRYTDDTGADALIRVACLRHGVVFATRLVLAHPAVFSRSYSLLTASPALTALRRALAAASDEDYAAARASVTWPAPSERAGQLAAYLFPTESWWTTAKADAALITCAATSADAAKLLDQNWGREKGTYETLAAELRGEVAALLANEAVHSYDAAQRTAAARALAEIPTDAAFEALLEARSGKEALQALHAAAERFPVRAIRVGLAKLEPAIQATVMGWIAARPDAWQSAPLSPALREKGEALLASVGPRLPEAEPSELPDWLTTPPWARPPSKLKLPTLDLTPVLPAPEVVLTDAETARGRTLEADIEAGRGMDFADVRVAYTRPGLWIGHYGRARGAQRDHLDDLLRWTDDGAVIPALLLMGEAGREILTRARPQDLEIPALADERIAKAMFVFLDSASTARKALAHAWMARHPAWAAAAFVPATFAARGKQRTSGLAALRHLASSGHEATLRAAAASYGPEAEAAVEGLLTADPLTLFAHKKVSTTFVNLATLPRPELVGRGKVLPAEALDTVVQLLAQSPLDDPHPLLEPLRELCTPSSLAALGWQLFQQWIDVGAPSKEGFGLTALGHVGDDACASQLAVQIRKWPGESQHKRAVNGLDVLLAIGTDVALMHLNGIAQKVKFQGIKDEARQRIDALATRLGLTAEELSDRLVPDLGLDEAGSMTLDYGPRQFTVGFDEALKPFVKDETGKRIKDLPKPAGKDDPALAEASFAAYKQLKKDVRALAGMQLHRLERAMITERRWAPKAFVTYLATHPLVGHLVRRLVWAAYRGDELVGTFRVAEDGSFADASDDRWEVPDDATVGLVHPVALDAATLGAWGEVLSDYELVQPFQQLGRPVYRLTPEEAASHVLTRGCGPEVPVGRVLGLTSKGWVRGQAQDAGVAHWLTYPLPDGGHQLYMALGGGGIWTGMVAEQTDMPTIEGVSVERVGSHTWRNQGVVPWSDVPPALVSEVLDWLAQLHA